MSSVYSPKHYFAQVVLASYETMRTVLNDGVIGRKRDLAAVATAAGACLNMADYITRDPVVGPAIPGAPSSKEYRRDLSKRFKSFAFVRDMANAWKHKHLNDSEKTIEGIEAMREAWALIRYRDGNGSYFQAGKVVLVDLLDGRKLLGEYLVAACVNEWAQELKGLGVIGRLPELQPLRVDPGREGVPTVPTLRLSAVVGEYISIPSIQLDFESGRLVPLRGPIGEVKVNFVSDVTGSMV